MVFLLFAVGRQQFRQFVSVSLCEKRTTMFRQWQIRSLRKEKREKLRAATERMENVEWIAVDVSVCVWMWFGFSTSRRLKSIFHLHRVVTRRYEVFDRLALLRLLFASIDFSIQISFGLVCSRAKTRIVQSCDWKTTEKKFVNVIFLGAETPSLPRFSIHPFRSCSSPSSSSRNRWTQMHSTKSYEWTLRVQLFTNFWCPATCICSIEMMQSTPKKKEWQNNSSLVQRICAAHKNPTSTKQREQNAIVDRRESLFNVVFLPFKVQCATHSQWIESSNGRSQITASHKTE